ncbi:protein FAM171A1-like [Pantherophis guttatus]|uniref:Protein FAM171A1-like n=1 Tax=Pantherophis guttatus TaxID=94885 RepID=A0A6P9AQN5_PANGU|nr:protein FAM171A1-like [Pantherophis guttatus]
MSPTNSDHIVMKNSNIDQKMFLLEIVGGVVFVLLVLMCFLVHYCRKKCMKPRQLFKKLQLSSTLRGAKMDQSTSTSNLSLVVSRSESELSYGNRCPESSGHEEVVIVDVHVNKGCSVEQEDLHTPVLQHSTSQEFNPREELLFDKENDKSFTSLENMAISFINGRKSVEKTEGYGSPDKEDYKHSPMLSQSLFEKQEQARSQVELSSPHSQQQMQPQHLAAQAISQQEAGTGDWKPQHVVMSESVSIPSSLSDELLTKKALTEVARRKPLPHPRSWFVSLDGDSNVIVRHSYIDFQTTESNGINNSSLDSGDDMNERKQQVQIFQQKDLDEVGQSGSECGTAVCGPENNTPRCVLEGGRSRRGGQLPSLQEETKRGIESLPKPLPSAERNGSDIDDANHQREDKKTPWQKLEERPVLAFNLK